MSAPGRATVAVLTYRRTPELVALLPHVVRQAESCGRPARVLVVDNDPDGGAGPAVSSWAGRVTYVHEAAPGIAAARNRALEECADDELLIFLDDDEVPREGWLERLLATHLTTGAAAVAGPVVSEYAAVPPDWVVAGRFFERRRPATGTRLDVAATNNLLLDVGQVRALGLRFDEAFGIAGGSDTLFTRQLAGAGARLVWCAEAVVVDRVPASRLTARWVLQKALRSGNTWSRTSLAMTTGALPRLRLRVRLGALGLVRVLAGAAQGAAGCAGASRAHQARGARRLARGAGMLLGAYGYVYREYRRPRSTRRRAPDRT